jgi:hypothetical protein
LFVVFVPFFFVVVVFVFLDALCIPGIRPIDHQQSRGFDVDAELELRTDRQTDRQTQHAMDDELKKTPENLLQSEAPDKCWIELDEKSRNR